MEINGAMGGMAEMVEMEGTGEMGEITEVELGISGEMGAMVGMGEMVVTGEIAEMTEIMTFSLVNLMRIVTTSVLSTRASNRGVSLNIAQTIQNVLAEGGKNTF
jgi:hypothetical protein